MNKIQTSLIFICLFDLLTIWHWSCVINLYVDLQLQGYSMHLNGNQPLEKYFSLDEVRGGVSGYRLLLILSGVMK